MKPSFINDKILDEYSFNSKLNELLNGKCTEFYISDYIIKLDEINIPNDFKLVRFKDCTFASTSKLIIKNNSASVLFINCKSSSPSHQLSVCDSNIDYFSCKNSCGNNESIFSYALKRCSVNRFKSKTRVSPHFENVTFKQNVSISITNFADVKLCVFNGCRFESCKLIKFECVAPMAIKYDNCTADIPGGEVVEVKFNGKHLNRLEVINSKLNGINFDVNCSIVDVLSVRNSIVNALDAAWLKDGSGIIKVLELHESSIHSLNMRNRDFTVSVEVNKSKFEQVPNFLGASMPNASLFLDVDFGSENKGKEASAKYRFLRHVMESYRDRESEGIFYALEQECLLNEIDGWWRCLTLRGMYSFFSEFGTNYVKPIMILCGSIIVFSLLYALLVSAAIDPSLPFDFDGIKRAIVYSLKQVLQPFHSLKSSEPLIVDGSINLTLIFLSVFQSIFSLACIALSGLALRWKFKRG